MQRQKAERDNLDSSRVNRRITDSEVVIIRANMTLEMESLNMGVLCIPRIVLSLRRETQLSVSRKKNFV